MNEIKAPTLSDLANLPMTVGVPMAGRFFGLGKDVSYELARRGEFPAPVLPLGGRLRVTKAALCQALGLSLTEVEEERNR